MNKAMEIKKEKREYRLEVLVERYCMARAAGWKSTSGKTLRGRSSGMEKHQRKDTAWQERRDGKAPAERHCVAGAAEWKSTRGKILYGKSGGMEKHQKNWLADRIER